jgi:hypothetical protein
MASPSQLTGPAGRLVRMGTSVSSSVSVLRTALVTTLILVRIRAEEALASAHFGDDQIAYCAHESGSFRRLQVGDADNNGPLRSFR